MIRCISVADWRHAAVRIATKNIKFVLDLMNILGRSAANIHVPNDAFV